MVDLAGYPVKIPAGYPVVFFSIKKKVLTKCIAPFLFFFSAASIFFFSASAAFFSSSIFTKGWNKKKHNFKGDKSKGDEKSFLLVENLFFYKDLSKIVYDKAINCSRNDLNCFLSAIWVLSLFRVTRVAIQICWEPLPETFLIIITLLIPSLFLKW